MKFMKLFSFFIFAVFCCTTYADGNKQIFIGQNGEGESAKTAFILEISAEDLNNVFVMNENGEIFLRADKVIALSKEMLVNFAAVANFSNVEAAEGASQVLEHDNESWKCDVCKSWNSSNNFKCRICKTPRS